MADAPVRGIDYDPTSPLSECFYDRCDCEVPCRRMLDDARTNPSAITSARSEHSDDTKEAR